MAVALAVAAEVDPRGLQRVVALGHERHLRPLDPAHVALPGNGLVGLPRVVGIVVANLANEHGGLVDDRAPDRLEPRISRSEHEVDRLIEATGLIGEHDAVLPGGRRHERRGPLRPRVSTGGISDRTNHDPGPLFARQPVDLRLHGELPATDQRDHASDHRHAVAAVTTRAAHAGQPPRQRGWRDPDPRRRGGRQPRGHEA